MHAARDRGVASERLGPLVSAHPPDLKALVGQTRVARAVGLLGRFGLLLSAVVAFRTGDLGYLISIGGMGGLFVGAGWLVGRQAAKTSFLHVDVHRNGLRVETSYETEEVRWDELQQVQIRAALHCSGWGEYDFVFRREGRPELGVIVPTAGVSDPGSILESVIDGVSEALLPDAKRVIGGSKTVEFGPLVIHRDWLASDGEKRTWGEIDHLVLHEGRLRGRSGGSHWFSHRVGEIPNLPVLLELARDRLSEKPTLTDWIWTYGD